MNSESPLEISQADYHVCAICIAFAQRKLSYRSAQILLRAMTGTHVGYKAYSPLTYMWTTYFAPCEHTLESYNTFADLLSICNARIESYIKRFNEGTLAWKTFPLAPIPSIPAYLTYPTPVSLPSIPARASSNSTDSTQKLNSQKTSLDQLRLRMATLLAKVSNTSSQDSQ